MNTQLRPECAYCKGTGFKYGISMRYSASESKMIKGEPCEKCNATGLARAWLNSNNSENRK